MNEHTQFILNGEFIINLFEREVRVGKTLIKYSGSGNAVETITCKDVLDEAITVFVSVMVWATYGLCHLNSPSPPPSPAYGKHI